MVQVFWRLIVVIALAFLTSACRSGEVAPSTASAPVSSATISEESAATPDLARSSTLTPSVTLTPTSVPTFTPTASPTATATPTATPEPHVRLENGRWLQQIGDYSSARREFAELLAGASTPAEAAEARYRLAQCYLEDQAAAEATVVLVQMLATSPTDDPFRAASHFLLGEAFLGLGRWSDAEAAYQEYLPLAPELSSLVWQRIGSMREAQNDLGGAADAYGRSLTSSPDSATTTATRRSLARVAIAAGDRAAAIAQYDLIRGTATTGALVAEMQWLAGQALFAAGDSRTAQQRWQAAVNADERSGYAHSALVALLDAKAPVDEFQRGLVDYHQGIYQLAIEAFDRYRRSQPKNRVDSATFYTGMSELALGATQRGIAQLDLLLKNYPNSVHLDDAWLAKGQALAKAGQMDDALTVYRDFARQRPRSPLAPSALLRAATLESDQGKQAAAASSYLELARLYPAADEGWRSYQAAGLIHFRSGDWRTAGEVWREMAEAPLAAWIRPVAGYWLGRAQDAAGEVEAARQSWTQAWEADPGSYYGQRAAAWLSGQISEEPVVYRSLRSTTKPRAQIAEELATWLRSWAGEGAIRLPAAVTSDPNWLRGQTMLTLGLRSQGLAALDRVQGARANEPWTLAALALWFSDAGAHRLSIVSAGRLAELWPGGTMREAPEDLQRLAYPLPYAPLLNEQGRRWDLDVRLLASVIRQESLFEHAAVSTAGARGLMQVMPATAQGIAGQLGWRDFESGQAYLPYVNVTFGAYYLHQNLGLFDESLPAALGAYNGGPGNMGVWRSWAPDDDDLMVALINFSETRIYVQSVSNHYEAYLRLYPD